MKMLNKTWSPERPAGHPLPAYRVCHPSERGVYGPSSRFQATRGCLDKAQFELIFPVRLKKTAMPRSPCNPRSAFCCSRTAWRVLCALGAPRATPAGSFRGSRGCACCHGFVRTRPSFKVTPVRGVHLARGCLAIVSVRLARHDTAHTGVCLHPVLGAGRLRVVGCWQDRFP